MDSLLGSGTICHLGCVLVVAMIIHKVRPLYRVGLHPSRERGGGGERERERERGTELILIKQVTVITTLVYTVEPPNNRHIGSRAASLLSVADRCPYPGD